ncbi:copper-resistant cuproprotein CopI [Vibrio sp.]|uniref:copper-resistant cuproprotein CopI n=1 Tax=Vibrio sp. TaxID=678 RepID=UPI003D0EF634
MNKTFIALTLTMLATNVSADMGNSHSNNKAMDHSKMDHSQMQSDNSKMNHNNMGNVQGMSAVGMPAKGAKPDKVIHVILSDDMKITFKKEVKIEPNDVVQFVVMNTGKIDHEFAIGSPSEQLEHREMMKNMSDGHMHDSGNAITVEPGKAKQLMWHFHGDTNVEFACNIPGHAEAGMVKKVKL